MTVGRRRSTRGVSFAVALVVGLLTTPLQHTVAQSTPVAGAPEPCPAGEVEVADREPNNLVTELQPIAGAVCIASEVTQGDQDLFLWTVGAEESALRWTIELSGLPGQAGIIQLIQPEYASDGASMTGATPLLDDNYQPGAGPAAMTDFLLAPGDYIVGVGSSGPGPYRLLIAPGSDVPPAGESEPNDAAETAGQVEAAFALSGDRNGSVDRYLWTLDETAAASHWRLAIQFRLGDAGPLRLFTSDGQPLFSSFAAGDGRLIVEDIGLDAGAYIIEVPQTSPNASPYILEATPGPLRALDLENEPNDDTATAASLIVAGPTTTLTGRLATTGGQTIDTDIYRLTIDQSTANRQMDLKVFWQGGGTRTVCLKDSQEQRLRCADGDRGVAFNDLIFQTGDYFIEITGTPNPADPYLLRLDVTIEAIAGYETEPNDTQLTAGVFDTAGAEPTAQGRFIEREEDFYRFTIDSEPQLWLAVVEGTGVERIAAVNAAGQVVASDDSRPGTGKAQVSDLYLLPGDHWFSVIGTDSDYTVRLVPLGPPDPSYEREPNDIVDRSQPIRIGETRAGRLVEARDADIYRFALLAEEHVTIRVTPPADGTPRFRLEWGSLTLALLSGATPGEPLVYEALLRPGDYVLTLDSVQPSEERYQIVVERNDPFLLPDDIEPNDTPAQARPFPTDLSVSGVAAIGSQSLDIDWYLLSPDTESTEIVINLEAEEGANLSVEARALAAGATPETELPITPRDADDLGGVVGLPPGQPIVVGVSGRGEYRLSIDQGDGRYGSPPAGLSVTLDLTAPFAEVAAYWPDAQRVEAALTLTNSGADTIDVTLDSHVSNELWRVTIETPVVTLAAGETATVPMSVRAAPDALADYPVRVTVRAQDSAGQARTASLDIAVGREAPPLNPETGWRLPQELPGGLNVAWHGLGGTPVQTDPNLLPRELALYDDLAASGVGWFGDAADLAFAPIELTVDLAGEEAIPLAGITLNPFAYDGLPAEQVRAFDVLVSEDGQTFEPVFAGELSALPVEQSFVFTEPVDERFVRLRVLSSQLGEAKGEVVLGEWKVIALPGWSLSTETAASLPDALATATPGPASEPPAIAPIPDGVGLNIAAPSRGGHIVLIDPQFRDERMAQELLVAGGEVAPLPISPSSAATWVIGFQHDRAARISALSWVDPAGLAPDARRFERVELAVSVDSPIGPWTPIGAWTLDHEASNSVFALDQPVWARYVRFTTTTPAASEDEPNARPANWTYPAQIAIFEQPTDGLYLSIAGEWGQDSRAAAYEVEHPTEPIVLDADAGNDASEAIVLPLGADHRDSAWVGRDEDWFRIAAPADAPYLEFSLTGSPSLDVEIAVFTEDGAEVPLTAKDGTPRERTYVAEVTPGANYLARITEPPTSLVIAFDTSQSLLFQLPIIYQGLASYAHDVVAGQEVVNFLPFGERLLLEEWGDDPYALQLAITNYPRTAMSSDVEAAQIEAIRQLDERTGTRAILLITDAETGSYDKSAELWGVMGQSAPRVFAVNIGAGADPWTQQD